MGHLWYPHGAGSFLNDNVNQILKAMHENRSLAVCAYKNLRTPWDEFFLDGGLRRCGACRPPKQWYDAYSAVAMARLDQSQVRTVKGFLYRQLYQWTPYFLKEFEQFRQRLNFTADMGPYVGVHVRRGDKCTSYWCEAKPVGLITYAKKAKEMCHILKTTTVFVTTDSPGQVVHSLTRHLGSKYRIVTPPKHNPREFWQRGSKYSSQGRRDLLLEMKMLIQADGFIGTASSNLGRFVYFMRSSKKRSWSLDDGGNFLARPGRRLQGRLLV